MIVNGLIKALMFENHKVFIEIVSLKDLQKSWASIKLKNE